MSNHALLWEYYSRLQRRCIKSTELDDHAWGLERALDQLVAWIGGGSAPSDPEELFSALQRAVDSGSRLQRARTLNLRTYFCEDGHLQPAAHTELEIEAELSRLASKLAPLESQIVNALALGYSDREIASQVGITPGATRTRISRLRSKLAA